MPLQAFRKIRRRVRAFFGAGRVGRVRRRTSALSLSFMGGLRRKSSASNIGIGLRIRRSLASLRGREWTEEVLVAEPEMEEVHSTDSEAISERIRRRRGLASPSSQAGKSHPAPPPPGASSAATADDDGNTTGSRLHSPAPVSVPVPRGANNGSAIKPPLPLPLGGQTPSSRTPAPTKGSPTTTAIGNCISDNGSPSRTAILPSATTRFRPIAKPSLAASASATASYPSTTTPPQIRPVSRSTLTPSPSGPTTTARPHPHPPQTSTRVRKLSTSSNSDSDPVPHPRIRVGFAQPSSSESEGTTTVMSTARPRVHSTTAQGRPTHLSTTSATHAAQPYTPTYTQTTTQTQGYNYAYGPSTSYHSPPQGQSQSLTAQRAMSGKVDSLGRRKERGETRPAPVSASAAPAVVPISTLTRDKERERKDRERAADKERERERERRREKELRERERDRDRVERSGRKEKEKSPLPLPLRPPSGSTPVALALPLTVSTNAPIPRDVKPDTSLRNRSVRFRNTLLFSPTPPGSIPPSPTHAHHPSGHSHARSRSTSNAAAARPPIPSFPVGGKEGSSPKGAVGNLTASPSTQGSQSTPSPARRTKSLSYSSPQSHPLSHPSPNAQLTALQSQPQPADAKPTRTGWFNAYGDQLWTNSGGYVAPPPGFENPGDLVGYPRRGEGWMNENGRVIDMEHRLVRAGFGEVGSKERDKRRGEKEREKERGRDGKRGEERVLKSALKKR